MAHIYVIITAHHILFLLNRFSVIYITDSLQSLSFLPQNARALLTEDYLKMLSKKKRTGAYFPQTYRFKYFFHFNCKQLLIFRIAEFELKVAVHYQRYGLWKNTQLWFDLIWLRIYWELRNFSDPLIQSLRTRLSVASTGLTAVTDI